MNGVRVAGVPAMPRGRGFTLVEMLAVTGMMAVLAMAALPLAEISNARWKERELRAALLEIRGAIDRYKRLSDEAAGGRPRAGSGYPPTLESLLVGLPDASAAPGTAPRPLLRRIPRDPFAPDGPSAEASWGLRSYDSPVHAPRPGADVYDVHSLSPRMGSNGVPLRQW
jgi:general secretion pathway protein G